MIYYWRTELILNAKLQSLETKQKSYSDCALAPYGVEDLGKSWFCVSTYI